MDTQQCKKLITRDLQEAAGRCQMLASEIDETDLVDVHSQLDRILRCMTDAKSRLKDCEDY